MMISRIAWAGTAALLIATASFDASGQELEPRAYSPSLSGMNFLGFTYLRSTGGVGVDPSLPLDNVSAAINIASLGYARTFGLLGRSASVGLVLPYSRADVSGDVFEQQPDRNIRQTAQTRGIAAAKSNQDNSPVRNQSRADLLPADRVLEGARHGNGTVEQSWESGVVGQPLGGGAGAAPLFLRPLQ